MSDAPRVAVVGAGLAGLAAGLALTRRGYQVELFERSRLLGGKVTSFVVDGHEVDNGQHVFLGCCSEFIDFARDAGMADSLHLQPRFSVTVLSRDRPPARLTAAALPAPLHLLFGFARYPLLGLRDRLRVAGALQAARRSGEAGGDMDAWLTRHGQNAATRRAFWEPFLVPALNAPLRDVAAEDGLFVLRTAFLGGRDDARIGYLTVPLARLAEAAAARLHGVHRRAAVAGIEVRDGRCAALRLEDGSTAACDACVLAVPPRRLAAILGPHDQPLVSGLDAFRTQPIVDVHLWYDRPFPGMDFAALLDSPVQWVFAKGPGYLCCSMSAAAEHVQRPEGELVDLCNAELAACIAAVRDARLLRGAATRDPDATFVPAPGLRRPGPRTAVANVFIAGAWTDTGWPATMESAVRSGRSAAAAVSATLESAASPRQRRTAAIPPEMAHAV
jgi:squalene-associated FAD-dependent desaturase